MRLIGFEDADGLLSWNAVADALAEGHARPEAEIGDLLLTRTGRALLNRGAWIEGLGIAMKSVTVYPDNNLATPPLPSVQGGMLLFDEVTGSPVALIDGILVTKWKTAGDSVLGARLLARPDSATLVICGAGAVARTLVEAYREVMPDIDRILVWNRTRERAEAFVAEMAGTFETPAACRIEAAVDLEGAVRCADIVATATMATVPFLKGEWLRPGTHVDLIGAYRPDMREAEDGVLIKGEIFVDSRRTTLGHIGEIQIPLAAGTIAESDIGGDLHDLCAGRAGRSSPEAITVFKNGGGAHLDLMVGALIRRLVEGASSG